MLAGRRRGLSPWPLLWALFERDVVATLGWVGRHENTDRRRRDALFSMLAVAQHTQPPQPL